MRNVLVTLVLAASMGAATSGQAQPRTRASDGETPESIVAALYDVISGPAGQARDWDRFRGLFAPGARLIPASPRADGAAPAALSPEDYIQRVTERFLKDGFFEKEIARRTEAFGTVTHVFSTYESRRASADEKPMARGINSIQLLKHGGRWWIATVLWDQERPDNLIPSQYLEGRRD